MNDQAPTIGHNSYSYMEMIEQEPALIFRDETAFDRLVDEINEWIAGAEIDLDTDKGRKAIASRAALIVKRKTAIDGAGKALNEGKRKEIDAVDAVRRKVRMTLDDLRDKAREPLTVWEQREEKKKQRINDIRIRIDERSRLHAGASIGHIDHLIGDIEEIVIDRSEIGPQALVLEKERGAALERLRQAKADAERVEAERRELEQLRKEKAERERAEAERQRQEDERARQEQAAADRQRFEAQRAALADEPAPAPAAPQASAPAPASAAQEALAAAKRDLMRECGLSESVARMVVLAIAKGKVAGMAMTS